MQTYKVTGFINGVWSTITVKTIPDCISLRASERGMTVITNIEERM